MMKRSDSALDVNDLDGPSLKYSGKFNDDESDNQIKNAPALTERQ